MSRTEPISLGEVIAERVLEASSIGERMENHNIFDLASNLIRDREFERAERLLLNARDKAIEDLDIEAQHRTLLELIELYCIMEPPKPDRAEKLSLVREQMDQSGQSMLQTAMVLYYSQHDASRTLAKLREAIEKSRAEQDDGTVYSSLSLLGLALLDLDQVEEAAKVLREIKHMVEERESFVVGDETAFLERAQNKGLELDHIRTIASALVPICRNPMFLDRLKALANS